MKPLYIYNLFPRLYKDVEGWKKSILDIKKMGFNSVFINPFHEVGFSGSLYAVKDYYRYNELFFSSQENAEKELADFINFSKEQGVDPIMDLVVNHVAFDSILMKEHKSWFKHDESGKVINPGAWQNGEWVTWGDLASFDLEKSLEKSSLWDYLLNVCEHYAGLGFSGFRCDAAYQVPDEFWVFLIAKIKDKFPKIYFLAETLGCTPVQIQAISKCGFDYNFNSSKWWNFNEPWCLEQYELTRTIVPSVSFPESHDTDRLMTEVSGNENAFLQKLYFSGIFSKGFMVTSGVEYGFRNKISTVSTKYQDWEKTGKDYTKNIKELLRIKDSLEPLKEESRIEVVEHDNWQNVFCFIKEHGEQRVLVCINKDVINSHKIEINKIEDILNAEKLKDYSPERKIDGYIKKISIELLAGEVKIIASENHFKEN